MIVDMVVAVAVVVVVVVAATTPVYTVFFISALFSNGATN